MADKILRVATSQEIGKEHPGNSVTKLFMERLGWDVRRFFTDFEGDLPPGGTSPGALATYTNNSGTLVVSGSEGTLSTIGTTLNDYCFLYLPGLSWYGQNNACIACRLHIDTAITTTKVEVGFSDSITNAGVVNALATPTFNATNGVVCIYDTSDTAYWQLAGVKAATAATKIEDSKAPVADTYQTIIVALENTNAKMFLLNEYNDLIYESAWMADAITATTALVPWVGVQTRTTAARSIGIDFIDVIQQRTTS
jgi:hypothetical protein